MLQLATAGNFHRNMIFLNMQMAGPPRIQARGQRSKAQVFDRIILVASNGG
jgi:hypothetical protein